jgi:hypothetical protein
VEDLGGDFAGNGHEYLPSPATVEVSPTQNDA